MSTLTPAELVKINELADVAAEANYFLCAPPEFARPFRLDVKRIGSVWVTVIPELDFPIFNQILGLGTVEPITESMLDEIIAFFQKAGCKNYMAQVSSLVQPSQYEDWLNKRGFKPGLNVAKCYRGTEQVPAVSTDLRLERIGEDQADAFADVVLPVFGMPPVMRPQVKGIIGKPGWHHYVAFDGDKPVSAAAMFIHEDVAWGGWASTLKTHRRRGAQSAMISRLIEDGAKLGCKWFAAETHEDLPEKPNPSYHNMLRYGFKLAYMTKNYIHISPTSSLKKVRRAFFVTAYGLKYEGQRLLRLRKAG